ncbi:MAG: hypothetical protein A4E49_01438 [Methanosaeta sp. PtaU1.Bin112]|nr:MAG: hypothetical protein A4E49_01438 [Methanosaeta sp. PtaU1.Bin112]
MKFQSSLIFILLNLVLLSILASCSDLTANDSMIDPWTDTSGFLFPENEPIDRPHNASNAIALENQSNMTPLITPCIPIPEMDLDATFGGENTDVGWSILKDEDGGYIIAGSTSSYGAGGSDVWLVMTDSMGYELWNRTFGGTSDDMGVSFLQTSNGDFIITGFTRSYGAGSSDVWLIKTDSTGNELWNKTFGGERYDDGYSIQQTSDDGYVIAGVTNSYGAGRDDVWLVKTDSMGNELWNKTFGGESYDDGYSIQQTSDDGYVIAGVTNSYGAGGYDVWLVKTDINGNELWNKTFGGVRDDRGSSVQQTSDGGFVITGFTASYGAGSSDVWLVKTDSAGNKVWDRTFGGVRNDRGYSIQQTSDGGFVITGFTASYGAGYADVWLVKTDSAGNELWNNTFGGEDSDRGHLVLEMSDRSYIIAGYTYSQGSGLSDVWLVKTDSAGIELWDRILKHDDDNHGYSVQQTSDDGYIIAGDEKSRGGPFKRKEYNFLLIKTDSAGNKLWERTFGGQYNDRGYSVRETSDGGYVIAGYKENRQPRSEDVWLIKTDSEGNKLWDRTFDLRRRDHGYSVQETSDGGYVITGFTDYYYFSGASDVLLIKTDSAGNKMWYKTFGGKKYDCGRFVQETSDGGFIITGFTESYGAGGEDAWLVKTNSTGKEVWNVTFGGPHNDRGYSVRETSDGGYVITGGTKSYGAGGEDMWLVKTDSMGNELCNKTFGGRYDDCGYSVWETDGGDYLIAGSKASYGKMDDILLVKTDSAGCVIWERTFGGSSLDKGYSVQETSDGNCIIAGFTGYYGDDNVWLIKTHSGGDVVWNVEFGGGDEDEAYSVQPTSDGGYILAGRTYSFGAGDADAWLVKTNSAGGEVWNATFGGADEDWAVSAWPTSEGGYYLAGGTASFGGGGLYAWLIKTDSAGRELWNTTLGNADNDSIASIQPTSDGGCILAGRTYSFGAGDADAWLVKINPAGGEVWNVTFGGAYDDWVFSARPTFDNGFILAGGTSSFGAGYANAWLIKTNSDGAEIWNTTLGGEIEGSAYSVQPTSDGGYILSGERISDIGFETAWLIKADSVGGEVWNTTFEGVIGSAKSVWQRSNGSYVIAGTSLHINTLLSRTDSVGKEVWRAISENARIEFSDSVQPTSDGCYVLAGTTCCDLNATNDACLIKFRPG